MNRDKQINDMAQVLKDYTKKKNITASYVILEDYAEALYNADYRKSTVIIGEIIKDLVTFAEDNEKQMLINGHSVWFINADDVKEFIAELKEKYESEGEKNGTDN